MKQCKGVYYLAAGILLFADLCYAVSNEYPMVSSILNEAKALRISGDVYKADALLTRAQRIAPRSADVYLEMAYLRTAQGDAREPRFFAPPDRPTVLPHRTGPLPKQSNENIMNNHLFR